MFANFLYMDDFLAGMIFIFLIFLLIGIISYILSAIALYTLAKNNGYENIAFLAWIPFANKYLIANMSGEANIFGKIYLSEQSFGITYLISGLLQAVPYLGWIFFIINIILGAYVYLNLYKKINYENRVVFTVLSLFVPFFATIYLFIKRDTLFDDLYDFDDFDDFDDLD